jgi:phospholipase/carboxylesterase
LNIAIDKFDKELVNSFINRKADKNPLLLLLHGYGSNEADLFSFEEELPDDCYVISARAPYDLQYGSYAWYAINFDADENKFSDHEQAKASRDLIANFIDEFYNTFCCFFSF